MGKARRNSLTNREGKKLPGPGIYKVSNMNSVKHENPKWSIKGKGKGSMLAKDGPGPGQYTDQYKKYNTPNYSFGNKFSKSFYVDKSNMPGPGTYQSPSTIVK